MKRIAIGLAALLIGSAAYAQTSPSSGSSSTSGSGSNTGMSSGSSSGTSDRSSGSGVNVGTSTRSGGSVGVRTESRREGVSVHSRTTHEPSVSVTRRRSVSVSDEPTTVRKVTKKKRYVSSKKPSRKVVVRSHRRHVVEPLHQPFHFDCE